MIQGLRFYKKMVSASIRSMMQYKFSFTVNFMFYAAILISDILPIVVILYHFKTIGGWSIFHIGALWASVNIGVSTVRCFCAEIHNFEEYIIRGTFDTLLLRPWPTLLILMSRNVQLFRLSGALQGLIVLIISLYKLQVSWLVSLYMPVLLMTSILVFFALEIIIASCAFWMGRVGDLLVFLFYGPSNAASYPLTIMPWAIRAFLTIWPVAFTGYFQLEYLFGYSDNPIILILAPVVAITAFVLALKLWHLGEKNYYSSGS